MGGGIASEPQRPILQVFSMVRLSNWVVWSYRHVIRTFAVNDLKLRYRNSFLGFLWSIVEPLLMLLVLFIVYSFIFKSAIPNYPIYLLTGLVLWYQFNRGTTMSLSSILGRAGILTKIFVPVSVPAISACLTSSMMMLFEFVVVASFMIAYRFIPPATILLLPLVLAMEFIFTLGVALALSVLNVYSRDFQYIWAVIMQAGFFLMPISYEISIFPPRIINILQLVPMARILVIARDVMMFGVVPPFEYWGYTLLGCLAVLGIGYGVSRRLERRVCEEL